MQTSTQILDRVIRLTTPEFKLLDILDGQTIMPTFLRAVAL